MYDDTLWLQFSKIYFCSDIQKKVSVYVIEQLSYLFIFALLFISTVVVSHFLDVSNVWGNFILKIVICLIIPNALLILLFRKVENLDILEAWSMVYFQK